MATQTTPRRGTTTPQVSGDWTPQQMRTIRACHRKLEVALARQASAFEQVAAARLELNQAIGFVPNGGS